LRRQRHHHAERGAGGDARASAGSQPGGLSDPVRSAADRIQWHAFPRRSLWRGAGAQTRRFDAMIDMLAASLGVSSSDPTFWMPLVFMGLLFLLIAGGVVLDGFDLGVGMLLPLAPADERGRMMALLSPWRDANEFWPLLGIGLFASAFPMAWGAVFGKLYGPLALMALGLALRSVSFEFRIRARSELKPRWVLGFWLGSVATAFAQGLILGRFATGYQAAAGYGWFAVL